MEIPQQINGLIRWGMARKPKKPQPPPRTIYLGEWLTRLGISVNDAAKAGGVGQSYISNMIAGRKDRPETSIMLWYFGALTGDNGRQ